MIAFRVPKYPAEQLLSQWLRTHLPAAPDGYLSQLLRGGRLTVGGATVDSDRPLLEGDHICLPETRRVQDLLLPPPRLLLETEQYLVADKPAGLAVHATADGAPNLTAQLQLYYRRLGAPYLVAPVHRLDLGTSGPVLFGKGRAALAALGNQFQEGRPLKQYLALVTGQPADCGELNSDVRAKGRWRPAATSYRVLRRWRHCSLLLATLKSGRSHQIRQQFAAAGHPLAGDLRYRSQLLRELGRPFLHHCRIGFYDPWQERDIRVTAPLPTDLRQLLARLQR